MSAPGEIRTPDLRFRSAAIGNKLRRSHGTADDLSSRSSSSWELDHVTQAKPIPGPCPEYVPNSAFLRRTQRAQSERKALQIS